MGVVEDHFAGVAARSAAALANAEQEARATGKEEFSLAPLEALYSAATLAMRGEELRAMYYVNEPQIRTMAELVALLRQMEQYE